MDKKMRNHVSSVFEDVLNFFWSMILLVVAFLFNFVRNFFSESQSLKTMLLYIGVLVVCILVIFGIFFIRWVKTTIQVNSLSIVVDRDTIFRKTTTINIRNISTIDISQNMLQKVLGTAKIQVDINSVVTANENDMKIILKLHDAIEFQKYILSLMNQEKSDANQMNELEKNDVDQINELGKNDVDQKIILDEFDFGYKFSETIRHAILSTNVLTLVFSVGSIITTTIFLEYDEMLFTLMFLLLPFIFRVVQNIFGYYDFKLKKGSDKIVISYGYFTRKKFSMPYSKVSGIKITQPILARMCKLYSVELINVGYGEENMVSLLLPLCTKEEMTTRIGYLFPHVELNYEEQKQERVAIWGYIVDRIVWMCITIGISFTLTFWIGIGISALWILGIFLSYKTRKIAYQNKFLYITSGMLSKKTVICNTKDVQNMSIHKNALVERFHISRMGIVLRSNMLNVNHSTGYFDSRILDEIIKEYN